MVSPSWPSGSTSSRGPATTPAFLARLDDDYPNLRAAIECARETRDGELLLRLATALWGFWSTRGYVAEGGARSRTRSSSAAAGRRAPLLGLCTLRILSGSSEDC